MSTPSTAAYPGGIAVPTLRAVVAHSAPDFESGVLDRLRSAAVEIRRLTQAREALDGDSVHEAHRASINEAVRKIEAGDSPDSIPTVDDVASIAADYSARRDALRVARCNAALATIDDLESAGESVRSALSKLAERVEKNEREDAKAFSLPFVPSQQLVLFRAASVVVAMRFEQIRPAIAGDPEHAGSPATYLADLLEVAAEW